jgi:hypothetical protein
MAIFVDLDEESGPPLAQSLSSERTKLLLQQQVLADITDAAPADGSAVIGRDGDGDEWIVRNLNRNQMTEALGCYPYVKYSLAAISLFSSRLSAGLPAFVLLDGWCNNLSSDIIHKQVPCRSRDTVAECTHLERRETVTTNKPKYTAVSS